MVAVPVLATCLDVAHIANSLDDLIGVFEELQTKTERHVERNVTMHQPDTWVVHGESDDEVSTGGNTLSVTSDRVCEVVGDALAAAET